MVLQDFLGSHRESYRILPAQDPETFCMILPGSYQDPVVGPARILSGSWWDFLPGPILPTSASIVHVSL